MIRALDVLKIAVAASGTAPSVSSGPVQQRSSTRDFADVISGDIVEHLRTKPKMLGRLDQLRDQVGDEARRFRTALPLITEAAQSLFKLASSGAVKFEALFPQPVLENVTRNVLNKVR